MRQLSLKAHSLQKCNVLTTDPLTVSLAFTQLFGPLSNQSVSLKRKEINVGKEKKKLKFRLVS